MEEGGVERENDGIICWGQAGQVSWQACACHVVNRRPSI